MDFITNSIYSEGLVNLQSLRRDMTRVTALTDTTHYVTLSSNFSQVFDGTGTNFHVVMPDATSLMIGHEFFAVNDCNTSVSVYNNSATNFIVDLYPRTRTRLVLKDNTASDGLWIYESMVACGGQSGYSIYANYNGNANKKYLEIYPGTDSATNPYLIIGTFAIVAVSLGSDGNNTGTACVYETGDLNTPLVSVSLSNQSTNLVKNIYIPLVSGNKLAVKINAGGILKPYVTVYLAFAG